MRKRIGIFGYSILAATIAGCGGSGGSGGSGGTDSTLQTGVFVDAPVVGLNFSTDSIPDGVTNEKGEFTFKTGETVTFKIGDIILGEVLGDAIVTPIDLVDDGGSELNEVSINIGQLLQTLDSDNDPETITISEETKSALQGQSFDFENEDFDTLTQTLLDVALPGKEWVTDEVAEAHLNDTFEGFAPEDGVGFTLEQLNNKTFFILDYIEDKGTDEEIDSTSIVSFNEDGTGTVESYDSDDSNPITWQKKIDGRLVFHEEDTDSDSAWDIVITATEITSEGILVSWVESGSDNDSGSGLMYTEDQTLDYEIDLTDKVASSVLTISTCSSYSQAAGYDYSFTDVTMTRDGSDDIDDDSSACVTGETEIQNFAMTSLAQDFDIPFNCVSYPTCRYSDLNKTLNGSSEGQTTVSTYLHIEGSNVITYTTEYQPADFTITEVLTLTDAPTSSAQGFAAIDLAGNIFYNTYGDDWEIEALTFDATGNGFSLDSESDTYEVLEGVLVLGNSEFIGLLAEVESGHWSTCWADDAETSGDCADSDIEHLFSTQAAAQAYADEQSEEEPVDSSDLETEFTSASLAGKTFFNTYAEDDQNDLWVLESLSFDQTGNGFELDGDTGTYDTTEDVLVLTFAEDDIEYIGLLEKIDDGHWTTCWGDSVQTTDDCTGLEIEHLFSTQIAAQAYVDNQND
jgi:hypothetical protein